MQTPSRRAFLLSSGVALAAAGSPTFAANLLPPLIDTHVHCFAGLDDSRFPYHPNGPYKPAETATPENLIKAMDAAGIDRAVIVHPEPYQDDHRYLEHVLTVGGKRLKGTALVFADQPKTVAQLPELAKKLPIVCVRIHAYSPERLPPFDKPELKQLWKMAGDLGLAVQLHLEPRYAPRFTPLIKEFKDVRVIIDHLGRPLQGTAEEHAVVVKWSDLPNTIMKISSLPKPGEKGAEELKPVIKQLHVAFGPDRLIYGGGFDGSPKPDSYRAAIARAREYLGGMPADDVNKILGLNAMRLFRFEV
jgi:predicted TIM-barrel fold metal-dependent hydrolase